MVRCVGLELVYTCCSCRPLEKDPIPAAEANACSSSIGKKRREYVEIAVAAVKEKV
jgi:hypothetical protein